MQPNLGVHLGCRANVGRHKTGAHASGGGTAPGGMARRWIGGTRSVRHVVGGGALRGRSPRTREGRIGPTAQKIEERLKRSEEREPVSYAGDWNGD